MTKAQKYTEQLGMNTGTAQNKLVKDILFKLINDLNLNNCFQCGEAMTRKDYTIEHKIPWRNEENAKDLFFNLNNISFSHFDCNVRAGRRAPSKYSSEEERLEASRQRKRDKYAKMTQDERDEINRKRRERRKKNKINGENKCH